jgi:hypothetical protein
VFGLIKDWSLIMEVTEFRKELQEAIVTLEKIARKIDEHTTLAEQTAQEDAVRNAALAQARLEVASGVTPTSTPTHHAPAANVPHDNPVEYSPVVDTPLSEAEKQRQARLAAQTKARAQEDK